MEATNRLRAKQCAHLKITARAPRAWWNNLWNICLVAVAAAAMSSENMSKLSHVEGLNHIQFRNCYIPGPEVRFIKQLNRSEAERGKTIKQRQCSGQFHQRAQHFVVQKK